MQNSRYPSRFFLLIIVLLVNLCWNLGIKGYVISKKIGKKSVLCAKLYGYVYAIANATKQKI